MLIVTSLGVALGAAAPKGGAGKSPPPRVATARAARAAPKSLPGWMDLGPVEAGRVYAPVGGPTELDEPALAPAPDIPTEEAPAEVPPVEEPARPTPLRRSPVASISARRAADLRLLAVRRGSGRIVFHDLAPGGTAGAELEGEWAVAGRCGERLRLDLAQPARGAGAPRGVGADLSGGAWVAAIAVPGQGCAAAAENLLRPHVASAAERSRFATAASGFAPDELGQVVATERTAWLVFAGHGRSRAVVARFQDGAWREAWSREVEEAQEIAAVLRRGAGLEGFFVTTRNGSPDLLQRVIVTDGGALADAPATLRG